MRRLVAVIALVVVFAAAAAACSEDEPPPVIQPTSAFQPTGSTGASGPTATGSSGPVGETVTGPTGIDQLPTTTKGAATGNLTTGQAAFNVTGDLRGSKALTTLVTAAYAPPPGVLAIVWAAGGADASNVGLGGLSFTGTKPTSGTLTLTVTVQIKANIATFVSSNGECRVTIGDATAKQVSGTFNCSHLSNGTDTVTGSVSGQVCGKPVSENVAP